MLTFEEIEDCFPYGAKSMEDGLTGVNAQWLHDFAHAVAAKERLRGAKTADEITKLRDALAESQGREAQTRHEVELCYRMLLSEPDTKGALFKAENLLREALALPQDGTALRGMIEAAKTEEREACARACENHTRTPETNGIELTLCAAAIRARK